MTAISPSSPYPVADAVRPQVPAWVDHSPSGEADVQPFESVLAHTSGNTGKPTSNDGWGEDGFGLDDLVDIINPLQHIPVLSTFYREVTGDQIAPAARATGGAIFGGPIGLIAAIASSVIESGTGQDVGSHALAALTGKQEGPQQTASDSLPVGQAPANQAPSSQAPSTQAPSSQTPINQMRAEQMAALAPDLSKPLPSPTPPMLPPTATTNIPSVSGSALDKLIATAARKRPTAEEPARRGWTLDQYRSRAVPNVVSRPSLATAPRNNDRSGPVAPDGNRVSDWMLNTLDKYAQMKRTGA